MHKGVVKWFNPQIGAGFIRSEDGDNVFFRFSTVLDYDQERICKGQQVSFDIMKNHSGNSLSAASVRINTTINEGA